MPGIVVFHRRWAVGSDDLVVPGIFLCLLHTIWLVVLSVVLATYDFSQNDSCVNGLHEHLIGYVVLLCGCILVEAAIAWVSLRGTILDTEPRSSMQYLLYIRLGILFVEMGWLVVGIIWLSRHYSTCPVGSAKNVTVGIIVCNWCVVLSVLITIWCTFDAAGRSWVKMKNYQRSLRDSKARFNYKRSGSLHRDWRHRKVVRAYQESWDTRCRLLFCCVGRNDRSRNSFTEIAKLLSEFFRDLDVVPSDVVAGLVLLRQLQKLEKTAIVAQRENETFQVLSGIPITPRSRFLALHNPEILDEFKNVIHYMRYALAVYGWPMYIKGHAGTGVCRLFPYLWCCCCCRPCCPTRSRGKVVVIQDNCCQCNHAAMCQMLDLQTTALVYITYHVEVGETPFFVAIDHQKKKIVVSIRGTLSLQDVITDLNAEGEQLPIDPPQEDWIGHKGMVLAAEYIRKKLREDMILSKAFGYDTERGTQTYDIVLVGHSLGAGTAAILAILLKQEFPNLQCYAYSPPGGLLSMPAVKYTKSFITSVVVGKDVVPRIGLHQMEALRSDLINAIKGSKDPKWKVIASSVACCHSTTSQTDPMDYDIGNKQACRDVASHPSDSNIALTVHQPLFPPGRIIHIVRHHPTKADQKYEKKWRRLLQKPEPVYQALWADNTDFDEVLISPVMIQDHMPDKVLEALQKVLSNVGPAKPQRIFSDVDRIQLLSDSPESPMERTPPHRLCLETSFTDLNPENLPASNHSSSQGETGDAAPQSATLSWEYNISLEDRPGMAQRNARATSIPPFSGQNVDLVHDDWMGLAPLATPETLSDVSSVSSRGSNRLGSSRLAGHSFSSSSAKARDLYRQEADERNGQGKLQSRMELLDHAKLVEEGDYFNESSHLLSAMPLFDNEGSSNCILVTEAVVEVEPRMPSEFNVLELESDGDGPTCEGARLSFDFSQDTSTSKTSEDTGYHGEQEVFMTNSPKDQASEAAVPSEGAKRDRHRESLRSPRSSFEDGTADSNKARDTPSHHGSYHSGADTMSDVFDHSLNSNPSPLISPTSTDTSAEAVHQQPPPASDASDCPQQPLQTWMGESLSPLRRLQASCGSPRKWSCGHQARLPCDIIPQTRMRCDESPRMCFHHDISADESSV